MIQQTNRRIHFTEYIPERGRGRDTDKPPTLRVDIKNGTLNMGIRTIAVLGLDGVFIKLYYEATKKIIGFTIHSNLSEIQLQSKKYRLVKANSSGQAIVSIAGITKQFRGLDKTKYKCEVKKYVEMDGVIEKGTTYYYVQLQEEASPVLKLPEFSLAAVPPNL